MEIGKNIKKARIEMHITQKQLSDLSGVKQATISAIENGRNQPTIPTVEMLSRAMNLNICELINGSRKREADIDGETQAEKDLLEIFRQLNEDGKEIVMDAAKSCLCRPALRQEGFIASME